MRFEYLREVKQSGERVVYWTMDRATTQSAGHSVGGAEFPDGLFVFGSTGRVCSKGETVLPSAVDDKVSDA